MRFWKFEKSNLEEILENEITEKEKEDLDNLDADQDNFSDNDNLSSNEDDSLFDKGEELEKDFDETSQSNDSSSTSLTSDSENSSSEENTLNEKSDNPSNTGNSQENDSSDNSDELEKSSNETSQSNDSSSSSSTSGSENSSSEENTLNEKSDNFSNVGNSQENDSSYNSDELEKDFDETSQSNDSSTSSTFDSENSSSKENTLDEKSDNSSNTGNSQENDSSDNSNELEKDFDETSQSNDSGISSSTSDSENSSSEENTLNEKSDNSSNTGNSQENDSSYNSDELEKDFDETSQSNDSSTSSTSDSENSSSEENTLNEKSDNSSNTGNSQENGDSIGERKEKLQELRDKLDEYSKKKLNLERKSLKPDEDISEESLEKDDYELSDQSNKFLEELSSLPSFKDRDRKDGYSIDTSKYSSIPDSLVRTLISKFLNQRFCKRDTDLNIRSNSFSKTHGFHKWEVKDMIVHLETEQLNKVLEDKYGYQYANGVSENVPLSFYFDMSGSMSEYTNMLAVIAIELLKKNVKVLIGFNERVNVQIDKIDKNITIDELVSVLESAGYSGYSYNNSDRFIRNSKVTYKFINRDIDDYLLSKECEKCVVFSDFDPLSEVICLSQKAKVYWFCFENYFTKYDLGRFKGFIYQTNSAEDIINGLIKVNENRFETLCFVSNNKTLQRRK